ncbi:MAG: hypothetical protein WC107_05595 [Patescibacteria group bacterium]|jgi:phage-related minor tail protein
MADNEVNVVITASDKASNIIAGIAKSLKGVSSAIGDLTKDYIAYGDEVDQLSRLSGMQNDEASRMIQFADDLSLSYDNLSTSLRSYSQYLEKTEENSAKMGEVASKYADEQKKSQEDLSNSLVDIASNASDKLTSLIETHANRLSDLRQSIKSMEQDFTDEMSDNKQELNDKLSDMDQDYADNREGLIKDLSKADSESQSNNIKERISELDADYSKRRNRAIRDAQQSEERAKREQDQKLELAKKRIQEENFEYKKQTLAIQEEQKKQEQSAKESFDRQAKYAAEAYAKQFASMKSEIAKSQSDLSGGNIEKVNIDTLAALSNQYLALPEGIERTNFALERFGRNGTEMMKILEMGPTKIQEMSASIQASLIVDEEKRNRMILAKNALDNFNDSVQSIRFAAADKLLSIFQKLPKPMQDFTLAIGSMASTGIIDGLANVFIILNNIGGIGPKIGEAALAMKGLAISTWAAIGPFVAVGAAIVAVGYAVYKLYQFIVMLVQMFQQAAANGKFLEFLNALNGYNIVKNVKLPGRASGGSVSGGSPYIVGERGPEMFIPSSNGSILPNGSSGGVTLVYSPMISLADEFELQTKLGPIIRNAMRGAV